MGDFNKMISSIYDMFLECILNPYMGDFNEVISSIFNMLLGVSWSSYGGDFNKIGLIMVAKSNKCMRLKHDSVTILLFWS